MRVLGTWLLFGFVLLLFMPIVLLIVVLWPIVWLLSIPFRIIGIAMNAVLAFVKTLLFLPVCMLGYKRENSCLPN